MMSKITRKLLHFCLINPISFVFILSVFGLTCIKAQNNNLINQAEVSLNKGIEFFHSVNIHGGYVYNYLPDLRRRWGEDEVDEHTIEVQEPGTPAVGKSFLTAYITTGQTEYLTFAEEAAKALIAGQNRFGGWDHTISFNDKNQEEIVSFDDNQTQSVIRFLMNLDQYSKDIMIHNAVIKALDLMIESQHENGAWPHQYPRQGNYHDYATFNDGGINDCIDVMIDAYKYYKKKEYLRSLNKAGKYIFISQLPPPQAGWAQQYNEFLQPVWARTFEPPSVCPQVTIRNINSLLDIFLINDDDLLLEPIPDAIRWLEESKMPNGKWGRFLELGTNKPLYYDRGRIRVNSVEELSVERRFTYGYEQNLQDILDSTIARYTEIVKLGRKNFLKKTDADAQMAITADYINELEIKVKDIISSQDTLGRWISKNDRYKDKEPNKRWTGNYTVSDRLSSAKFNANVKILCEYISYKKTNK